MSLKDINFVPSSRAMTKKDLFRVAQSLVFTLRNASLPAFKKKGYSPASAAISSGNSIVTRIWFFTAISSANTFTARCKLEI